MVMKNTFQIALLTCALSLLVSCGGGGDESSSSLLGGGGSGGSGSGGGSGSSNSSAISINLGDSQTIQEQQSVEISTANISSSAGSITSQQWSQLENGAPTVSLVESTNSISFDVPNVKEDTVIALIVDVTDSAGNMRSEVYLVEVVADTISIAGMPMMYSHSPLVGESVDLSIATFDTVGTIDWTVVSAPDGSELTTLSGTESSITFTPDVAGEYTIRATAQFDGESLETTFTTGEALAFDSATVRGADSEELFDILDVVESQSWVSSSELSREQLENFFTDSEVFTVIGYSEGLGLLVEYDGSVAAALDTLEEIRLQPGVDNVSNRLYEGVAVDREELIPNDGSAFDDLGNNWHLEFINAPAAWDITTGSAEVMIGISDSGFNVEHTDLTGRVFELLTDDISVHGTRAVGAIGALSNNGSGITGINWSSDMILAGMGVEGVEALFKADAVRVVNSSWAIPGYLASDFDPLDPIAAEVRDQYAIDVSRSFRRIAQSNLNRLFVWPAGNGIGNGLGNSNSTYGVDGRHHSPALHYDDKAVLNKQKNVVFSAALLPDGRLTYYSNYGKSVDIAAPTSYQSTVLDDGFDISNDFGNGNSGYAGTSAAAAVVSGVASLIYSLDPSLTGEQVKQILIDSASEFVTERYTAPNSTVTETLSAPIPVIDAEAALLLAQEIINGRVSVSHGIPDPFTREVEVSVASMDEGYRVVSIDWVLASSADGETNWQTVSNNVTASDSFTTGLDATDRYHRVTADITIENIASTEQTVVAKTENIVYSEVMVTTAETVSLEDITGVSITPDLIDGVDFGESANTDAEAELTMFVVPGSYKLRGTQTGFEGAATRVTVDGSRDIELMMVMSPDDVDETGALSGFITDEAGTPLEEAVVRISGGAQTNGFFASSTTDENGYYVFSNVSKLDSSGTPIAAFLVESSLDGYSSSLRSHTRIVSGEDTTENLTLLEPRPFVEIFADDFESGVNAWVATGFWNQVDLVATNIVNEAVDLGVTSLPPDEAGPQAPLPEPRSGAVTWWYGEEDTGSFIGVSTSTEDSLDGGTSEEDNEGTLTTPLINLLLADRPFLKFKTWWEIESVNPNASGYDLMRVQISVDGGVSFETMRLLNPFVDPNDNDRDHKGFTTAGFNRMPLWVNEEIDLTEYAGNQVRIRFFFDTVDHLFNGFRGWILDDFVVGDYTLTTQEKTTFLNDKAYQQFWDVHRKPQQYEAPVSIRRL